MNAQQLTFQSDTGFLFGVGQLPNASAALSYNSIFLDNRSSEFVHDTGTTDEARPSVQRLQARTTFFNFFAPFIRYIFAVKSMSLLLKLAALIPRVLPSTEHLKITYLGVASTILILDFVCLALRSFHWFPRSAPFLNPTMNLGRDMLRRLGRKGWYAWYLSQPARLSLLVTSCILVIGFLRLFASSLDGPSAAAAHPAALGAIRWTRNLFFMLGMLHFMWSSLNYMTEKNWAKQALTGTFCFAFGAIASLALQFALARPEDMVHLGP